MKTLEQAVAAYSEKVLTEAINVYSSLVLSGYTIQDLELRNQAILDQQRTFEIEGKKLLKEQQQQVNKEIEEYKRIAPICPESECGQYLMLSNIREPKGKGNIHGYKSLFYCSSDTCLYEKYTKQDTDSIYKELLEKEKANGS